MSIRASAHGGNARHPVSRTIFLAFPRDRVFRSQFFFAAAKVAAPFALVVGLVVAGSLQRGESPITELAQPGPWAVTQATPAATASGAVPAPASESAAPVALRTAPGALGTAPVALGAAPVALRTTSVSTAVP